LVDLTIGQVSAAATHQIILDQMLRDKYAVRSRLFADEADVVLRRKGLDAIKGSKAHISVIGATAGIIRALGARGFEVTAMLAIRGLHLLSEWIKSVSAHH
jgi:hypothetical protein